MGDAEQSVTYADRSGDAFQRMARRTTHAGALHQAGRRAEAETRFREAEQMQAASQPANPLLYGLGAFRYCDLLVAAPERTAWQTILSLNPQPSTFNLSEVSQRAAQTLKWAQDGNLLLLTIALDHLTLGRAALFAAILERSAAFTPLQGPNESAAPNDDERRSDLKVALQTARRELDAAVDGLRHAGTTHHIPRGLLTRAWLRFLTGARTGPESAQEDLDEAWEIAERGPMKLFLADIHLHRARLFFREKSYPWKSPQDDLAAAEKLINDSSYHRRDEELADAKEASKNWFD